MKVFLLVKAEWGLRALEVFTEDEIAVVERLHGAWTRRGYEAAIVYGADLQDVMQSFPAWFDSPTSGAGESRQAA